MQVTSDDGAVITIHELGGVGRPLFISHATGFHGRCYEPLAAELAGHFACSAIDYRGHGTTPWVGGNDEPVDWRIYGDDALVAADAIAPTGGVIGFGPSMGGAALLMAAHRSPATFDALVLFEPIVFAPGSMLGTGENHLAVAAQRRGATFESFEQAIDNYASKPPLMAFTPEALRAYVEHGFEQVGDGVRLRCTPEHEARTFEGSGIHDTWNLLPEIATRVTVVSGKVVDAGPASLGPLIADTLPNGTYRCLEHLDHFGPMTHPADIAEVIIHAAFVG